MSTRPGSSSRLVPPFSLPLSRWPKPPSQSYEPSPYETSMIGISWIQYESPTPRPSRVTRIAPGSVCSSYGSHSSRHSLSVPSSRRYWKRTLFSPSSSFTADTPVCCSPVIAAAEKITSSCIEKLVPSVL